MGTSIRVRVSGCLASLVLALLAACGQDSASSAPSASESGSSEPGGSSPGGSSPADAAPSEAPELPSPDWDALEPGVAARLRERRAAAEAAPTNADAWGAYAQSLHVHGLENDALVCYARAEELDASDFRWPYFGALAQRFGNVAGAIDGLRRAGELRADHAPLWALLANLELQSGDAQVHARADADYARALEADPNLIVAHIGRAKVALAEERDADALVHLERAAKLGPRTGEVSVLLERAHLALGDEQAARAEAARDVDRLASEPLQDAFELELRRQHCVSLGCVRDRAQSHLALGKREAAIGEWMEAVLRAPDSARVHHELAQTYFRVGDLERAAEEYGRAVELDDELAVAQRGLGNALGALERPQEAIGALRRALELDPSSHETRSALGRQLFKTGAVDEGRALIEEARAGRPDDAGIAFDHAMLLAALGENEPARQAFLRTLELAPDRPAFRRQYASFLQANGFEQEADEQWGILIETAPRDAETQLEVASVMRSQGRLDDAEQALRRGLEDQPGNARLRFELGLLLAVQGRLPDAVEQFELAAQAAPERAPIHGNLVRALLAVDNAAGAASACERAMEHLPAETKFLEQLAWLIATSPVETLRDGPRAVSLADELCRLRPGDPLALEVRAAAYAEARRFDAAMAWANDALEILRGGYEAPGAVQRVGAALRRYEREQPFRVQTKVAGR